MPVNGFDTSFVIAAEYTFCYFFVAFNEFRTQFFGTQCLHFVYPLSVNIADRVHDSGHETVFGSIYQSIVEFRISLNEGVYIIGIKQLCK